MIRRSLASSCQGHLFPRSTPIWEIFGLDFPRQRVSFRPSAIIGVLQIY